MTTKDEIRASLEQRREALAGKVETLRARSEKTRTTLSEAEELLTAVSSALERLDSDTLSALALAGLSVTRRRRRRADG